MIDLILNIIYLCDLDEKLFVSKNFVSFNLKMKKLEKKISFLKFAEEQLSQRTSKTQMKVNSVSVYASTYPSIYAMYILLRKPNAGRSSTLNTPLHHSLEKHLKTRIVSSVMQDATNTIIQKLDESRT